MTAAVAEPAFSLQCKVRFVTAASLFDGHDAAIQIMRRVLQQEGAEVVHLGHDRSVREVVEAAVSEDAQGIAISSYQGGHVEYFSYMLQLLRERGAGHINVYGGGGGVIVPAEIELLHQRGVKKIFSPEDGRQMGLVGMIQSMLKDCDHLPGPLMKNLPDGNLSQLQMARAITTLELGGSDDASDDDRRAALSLRSDIKTRLSAKQRPPVVGFTGTGGAGKSSLIDEVLQRFLDANPGKRVAVLSVDPTRKRTGGALLGDRIRLNAAARAPERIFVRSLATRRAHLATSPAVADALSLLCCAAWDGATVDLVVLETAGIGQSDSEVHELVTQGLVDKSVYVMTPEYGAPSQLEKIDMLDFADVVVVNKADKKGALDAVRDVKKQVQRNRKLFDKKPEDMPVFGTAAHRFHDKGTNTFFNHLAVQLGFSPPGLSEGAPATDAIIPPARTRYLGDIADTLRQRRAQVAVDADKAARVDGIRRALRELGDTLPEVGEPFGARAALATDVELREAPLFTTAIRWCSNLAAPDMFWDWRGYLPEFLVTPEGWLGPFLNLRPLVTIGLFLWQQKLFMPPAMDEQQRMQQQVMNYMMLFMAVMFFKVPCGLCLYFIASSLWGIAERLLWLPKSAAAMAAGGVQVVDAVSQPVSAVAEASRQRRQARKRLR